MHPNQIKAAWKAFRDLWVAGTVGGFLAALMRSVPLDVGAIAQASNGLFIYDLILRYLYMLWFIAYFLVSHLNRERFERFGVLFDVIQSVSSFAAAFALGIAVRGEGYQFDRSAEAFTWANGAIVIICVFSLAFFSGWRKWKDIWGLNLLRLCGAVAGFVGLVVARHDPLTLTQLVLLTLVVLALAVLLFFFGRLRVSELSTE